jgi:4-diphosphocytidyl-2-C-methyl-D-erythritol kinase
MILFPPAKVNLGLYITGKREDGYHNIESVMYPIPLYDVLEILPADKFSFKSTGLLIDGDSENNLCVKAYRIIQENHSIGNVMIHLRKNIPMGAGLGGGSADAAFVLRGLNELFELELSDTVLEKYAAQLGSDCAFFVKCVPQVATGRGEVLDLLPVSLKGKYMKVINPGIHISTKLAYSNVALSEETYDWEKMSSQKISAWKDTLRNDFERSVFPKYPELDFIKGKMYEEGALYAFMSGSGSTMIGIYDESPELTEGFEFEKILAL